MNTLSNEILGHVFDENLRGDLTAAPAPKGRPASLRQPVAAEGEVIRGSGDDETLRGTPDDDRVLGLAGSDSLLGLQGADSLFGGGGDDTLKGSAGDDLMVGAAGGDLLVGGGGDDNIKGGGGDDNLKGGGGADTLKGGGGDDTLKGGGGADNLKGGGGADTLNGGGGSDTLNGGGKNDSLDGRGGDDTLIGGAGDDLIFGGAGSDMINGGGGGDVILYRSADLTSGAVDTIVGFASGQDKVDLSRVSGIDSFAGLSFTVIDEGLALDINGGRIIFAGYTSTSVLVAGDFILPATAAPVDPTTPVTPVDPTTPVAPTDPTSPPPPPPPPPPEPPVVSTELLGTAGDDTLTSDATAQSINGLAGSDRMTGGGGTDLFVFKTADFAAGETDTITDFTSGSDKLDLRDVAGLGGFSDLVFSLESANLALLAGAGRIEFEGLDTPDDIAFGDVLLADTSGGSSGGVIVINESGVREIRGANGDDALQGGTADERILGFGGDDNLGAGAGTDTLVGGAGADKYVIQLVGGAIDPDVDFVEDFSYVGGDRIGLTEVLSGVAFSRLDEVVRATPTGADTVIAVKRATTFEDALILQNVTFETEDLISYGFTAPPPDTAAFFDNPYGFANNSLATADPVSTRDGVYVAWVDQQNLDGDPIDRAPEDVENNATRDIFIRNTQTGAIQRVTGQEVGAEFIESVSPALSSDGRFVAYVRESVSSNNNGDIFVRDMKFPDTDPVQINIDVDGDVGSAGTAVITQQRGGLSGSRANVSKSVVDISGDGRKVVFTTRTKLSDDDVNGNNDVYLRDLDAGTTTLISSASAAIANGSTGDEVKISEDGRYIAFTSRTDFAGAGTDGASSDLYLFDTTTGNYLLVSSPAAGGVGGFDISADASRIAFETGEAIDANDANGLDDIYVADIDFSSFSVTNTQRVSEAEGRFEIVDGDSAGNAAYLPVISPNGDTVAFLSQARDVIGYGDAYAPNSNGLNERLFLLDLESGDLTTVDPTIPVGQQIALSNHLDFFDDGFVFRQQVDAAPGGSRSVSDSIAIGEDVAPDEIEIANDGNNAKVLRFTSFRSTIDTPGDVDIFEIESRGDGRDLSVSVEGVDSGGGTLSDPFVRILRKDGDAFVPINDLNGGLAVDDNSGNGRDAFVQFDSGVFQKRYIEVTDTAGGVGSYRVRLNEDDAPSPSVTPDDFIF